MIRFAFIGVILIGALIAFGVFSLVRNIGTGDPQHPVVAPLVEVEDTPTPDATSETLLYFLQDIDLTDGQITLVLRDALTGQGDMFVRDQAAINAAQDVAYVNTATSAGDVLGMVTMAMMGVSPQDTVAQIYRGDTLVSAVVCTSTTCGSLAADRDVNLGPLMDAAHPLISEQAYLDNYEDYLSNLEAVNREGDYMFLDLRPTQSPVERQTARMELYLPTLVHPAGAIVDPNVTSALVRSILNPLLPEGASINGVTFQGTGRGLVADMDSGTPTLAGGAPIPFPDVEFTNVKISIEGASTLSEGDLRKLTEQPLQRTDYTDAFTAFVRDRLQSTCADCFMVKMNGDLYDEATITTSEPEGYRFDYYDLRDTP